MICLAWILGRPEVHACCCSRFEEVILVYSWTQRAGFQLVIMLLALRHGTLSSLRIMCGSQTLFSTQH